MRIDPSPNARLNGTGLRGSLEAYCSATGVVARTMDALATSAEAPKLREMLAEGERLTAKLKFLQ